MVLGDVSVRGDDIGIIIGDMIGIVFDDGCLCWR